MHARYLSLVVVLLVVSPAAAQTPARPASASKTTSVLTRDALNGEWRAVQGVLAGDELPPGYLQRLALTIHPNGYRSHAGDDSEEGDLRFEPSAASAPAQIDLKATRGPSKGLELRGIVKLEANQLTIAYHLGALDGQANRPDTFASDRSEHRTLVITYRRVK